MKKDNTEYDGRCLPETAKALIVVIILLFTLFSFGQDTIARKQGVTHSLTYGLDIANTLWGGTVNSRAVNFQAGYILKDNGTNVEVGLNYERFDKLNFEVYNMTFAKVFEPLKNVELVGGLEHGVIHRWKGYLYAEDRSSEFYYTYGANAEIRYKLTRTVWIYVQFNVLNRSDLATTLKLDNKFNFNNTFNIKIDL